MELSPPRESTSLSPTQEFPNILGNPKVYYCVYESLLLASILSQTNPLYTTPSYFSKIYHNFILGLFGGLSPSGFFTKNLHSFLISSKCATCPTHLTLLDLFTVITFA
jgi:hypothetical protein